jgi:tRNA (guanine-N7-)-methyltransferase
VQQENPSNVPTERDSRAEYEARTSAVRETLAQKCRELFPEPLRITLEVGCGHGHYLTAYAQTHPERTCVGVDLVTKRVAKGQNKKDKRALGQLHFIKAEALEFLDALPAHVGIDRCFVLFPDPWPKKRHWKNRIVQQALLDKLAQRAAPGCKLYLRTDHADYYQWMIEQVEQSPSWQADPAAQWPFEATSFFQEMMNDWQSLIAIRAPDPAK